MTGTSVVVTMVAVSTLVVGRPGQSGTSASQSVTVSTIVRDTVNVAGTSVRGQTVVVTTTTSAGKQSQTCAGTAWGFWEAYWWSRSGQGIQRQPRGGKR